MVVATLIETSFLSSRQEFGGKFGVTVGQFELDFVSHEGPDHHKSIAASSAGEIPRDAQSAGFSFVGT